MAEIHVVQMKHFEMACQNPQRQLQRLRTCVKNHFTSGKDRIILENFIKFLGVYFLLLSCILILTDYLAEHCV